MQALKNVGAILRAGGADYKCVVKTTIMYEILTSFYFYHLLTFWEIILWFCLGSLLPFKIKQFHTSYTIYLCLYIYFFFPKIYNSNFFTILSCRLADVADFALVNDIYAKCKFFSTQPLIHFCYNMLNLYIYIVQF